MKRKSNKKALILFIILVIVAAVVTIVRHELNKTKFNSSYVNGNTAGISIMVVCFVKVMAQYSLVIQMININYIP